VPAEPYPGMMEVRLVGTPAELDLAGSTRRREAMQLLSENTRDCFSWMSGEVYVRLGRSSA